MSWRWRSRWVGAVSAVRLGTAVARGGTITAASGWRSLTLAYTPSWSYAPSPVNEAIGPSTWSSKGPTWEPSSTSWVGQRGGHDLAGVGIPAEVQFPPGSARLRAVLLDQPLARPAELEAR